MSASEDGFLGRWSRRKREAEQAADAPVPESAPEPAPTHDPAAAAAPPLDALPDEAPDAPALTEAEIAALPRIEDLVEGSDIKAFLRAGVPQALRSAALRRVWMLTPAIRDYKNPAVDYAWDWNTPGGVPGDGCAPSPERAAQMLRDLITPRSPSPSAEPVLSAAEASDVEAPAAKPPAQGEAQDVALAQGNALAMPDEAEAPDEAADGAIRRRHGGALPS